MIIDGMVPGDPVEVAKAMKNKGANALDALPSMAEEESKPTADAVGSVADDEKAAENALEKDKAEEVNTEKPSEGKKTAAKKGGRKSTKKVKAEESADVNIDSNSLFNE